MPEYDVAPPPERLQERVQLFGSRYRRGGLHRDVYRDTETYRTESVTGPIPPKHGFDHAEEDLRENLERYINRFERWHDVNQ